MNGSSSEVECELIDLTGVAFSEVRRLGQADLVRATERVARRLLDAEGSLSGYSGKFAESDPPAPVEAPRS